MAAAYFVYLPTHLIKVLQNGVDAVVVYANDATDAKAMAKAAMGADANALWDQATATAIAAASNALGFRFTVKETYPNGVVGRTADITATGAGQDTIDEIGAALATALGGGAAYDTSSNVLTLTASANGAGDRTIEVACYPPTTVGQDAPIPGFFGTITHRGASSAALSVALCADAFVVPNLIGRCKIVL